MSELLDNKKLDIISFHRMLFIYNAVLDGWTVKKLTNNNFEFKKPKDRVKKEILLDKYLEPFVKNNLNLDHIISSS